MSRPSTYVFFVSYICLLIVAVALGTFLPIILKTVSDVVVESADVQPLTRPVPTVFQHTVQRLYRGSVLCGNWLLRRLVMALRLD